MSANWLGIDVGGANIKMADSSGFAISRPFALWLTPDQLSAQLALMMAEAPTFDGVAVTMTGELADCYATREEGVCRILEQISSILPANMVRVYGVDTPWMTVAQAARNPWNVAASNWHALARYTAKLVEKDRAILIDVGSTTVDIIPIRDGEIATEAKCDSQRLRAKQLVYTGIERTPLCAVASTLPLHGESCPVMAEFFATMGDVYLWLGLLPESPQDCDTADKQPKTRSAAAFRLARMVGEDGSTLAEQDIDAIAFSAAQAQADLVAMALMQQRTLLGLKDECQLITSGHGEFLIDAALRRLQWKPERLPLAQRIGPDVARCAPAFALARLAAEPSMIDESKSSV